MVDKPAGMLSVADEPGNADTLAHHTRTVLRGKGRGGSDTALGVVHRLDRDTSGLIVFARTAAAKRAFEAMMEMGKIDIAAIEAARRG